MSYLEYFGLNMEPFSNVAMGKFYFSSQRHTKAITKLTYAVNSMKGLALLVGSIGAGKTTIARRFLDSLPEDKYEAGLIVMVHSSVSADWMLKKIAHQMGIEDTSPDKLRLMGQLYERLLAIHESGKKAVVLIDEAQMLQTKEIMEEFRGLLNLEVQEGKLITFVLFGLPEIDQNLRLDEPLAQRVAIRINLEAMDFKETSEYIQHRMSSAGSSLIPFTDEAIVMIYRHSGGTPRLINAICDNALLEAFLLKKRVIDKDLIGEVLDDLGFDVEPSPVSPPPSPKIQKKVIEERVKNVEPDDDIDLIFQGLESN